MPFIGNKPASVPLTSADITDGIIVNADISSTAGITLNKLSGNPNFRNIVINGDMQIAQRSTSVASLSSSSTYNTVDRMMMQISSLGTWTQSQDTDVPTGYGFRKSLKMDCTTADASPSAGDYLLITQRFEGQNLQYLKKGTANAQSLTASFWVKSTKTGTFIVELVDNNNSRSISKSYTISASNTWEFKTLTFAGDTSGALNNDNTACLDINFWFGAGSTYTSGSLATSWGTTTSGNRAVGQVNCADSISNDFWLTGIQLEAGTSATDFEFLPYDVNLQRCQRYYLLVISGQGNIGVGCSITTSQFLPVIDHPVTMRTTPTLSYVSGNYYSVNQTGANIGFSTISLNQQNVNSTMFTCTGSNSFTAAGDAGVAFASSSSAFIGLTAEL